MGYTPEQMTTDPKCWPDHLHPEDARRILDECPRLVERGKGTMDYLFRRREGGYIWILDTFRLSMTMPDVRWSSSAPGPTLPTANTPSRLLLRRNDTLPARSEV